MKTLILFTLFLTLAATQNHVNFLNTGSYTYTNDCGKTVQITYVEDAAGVHITSHDLSPEDEKKIIEQIKQQKIKLQDQLNHQLTEMNQRLNHQLAQMNQRLTRQFGQFGKQFAFTVKPIRPLVLVPSSSGFSTTIPSAQSEFRR